MSTIMLDLAATKKKKKKRLVLPPLPPPGLVIADARPTASFYAGNDFYRIAVDRFDSVQTHQHYVQYTMNNLHGFLGGRNLITPFSIRNNQAKIIAFTFKTILMYNKIVAPYKFRLFECDGPGVLLGEPVVYAKGHVTKLYFAKSIVDRILDANSPNAVFKYSDDIKVNAHKTLNINDPDCDRKATLEQFAHQDLIYRLFIIADHLATHYIDEYTSGEETDWINHSKFGTLSPSATTTHIVYRLTSAVVRNSVNQSVLFKYNGSGGLFKDTAVSRTWPHVKQIENPVTEPSPLLRQLY